MWSVGIRCLCQETTITVPTTRQRQRSTTTKQIHDLFSTKAPGHSFVVLAAFDIAPHTILDSEFVIRDSGFSGRHSGRRFSKLPSPRVLSVDEPCKWANARNQFAFRPRKQCPPPYKSFSRKIHKSETWSPNVWCEREQVWNLYSQEAFFELELLSRRGV